MRDGILNEALLYCKLCTMAERVSVDDSLLPVGSSAVNWGLQQAKINAFYRRYDEE